jgi:hypothetical protein
MSRSGQPYLDRTGANQGARGRAGLRLPRDGNVTSFRFVSLGGDESARYLGKRIGYVARPEAGLPDAGQALTQREQEGMTGEAHARWRERQRRAWGTSRAKIVAGVEEFSASAAVDPATRSDLKVLRRCVARVDKRYASL